MTEPLDPEIKRLRKLSAGDIADEVGACKAQIADLEAKLDAYKGEAVRRDLREADGKLFRLALSAPGLRHMIDGVLLRRVMGDPFVDHFSRSTPTDWVMRCSARKAAAIAALILAFAAPAKAGDAIAKIATTSVSVTGNLTVTITNPLAIAFSPAAPSVPCNAQPGAVVAAITSSGGDGSPISYSLAGDTGDFAISGANVIVGSSGIAAASCGTTKTVVITATQL